MMHHRYCVLQCELQVRVQENGADCNHQMVKVILSYVQTYAHRQGRVCQEMLSVYSYQLSVN